MAVIETWYNQDLQQPVNVHYLDGSLFSHNGNGNRIGVHVFNNGEPVTLSGTVSGYVVTADGSTVPCTGSKSGNRASILIPAAAYQPGSVFITVFVTDGTTVTTIGAVCTTVMRSRTNAQVDPGSAVTDWTQTINAAMQSVETAAANLGGIVAVPYASITFPVPLGKYTYYNNNLYRCITPIASSESFTAAHWTHVRLGDDVSDLKSALNQLNSVDKLARQVSYDWGHGAIANDGSINDSYTNRIYNTDFKKFQIPVTLQIDSSFKIIVVLYNADKTVSQRIANIITSYEVPANTLFRITIYRAVEVEGEVADIAEFAKAVTLSVVVNAENVASMNNIDNYPLNTVVLVGRAVVNNITNAPYDEKSNFFLYTGSHEYRESPYPFGGIFQIALPFGLKTEPIKYRVYNGSSWSSWENCSNPTIYNATPSNFIEVIEKAKQETNATVRLEAGTYYVFDNVHNETYWKTGTRQGYRGINLANGIRIVGDGEVNIIADYSGKDSDILEGFSVFCIAGSCEIKNIKIQGSNIGYLIHDDTGIAINYANECVFENCYLTHNGSSHTFVSSAPTCIGGGTVAYTKRTITNCVFDAKEYLYAVNYHTASNAYGDIIISGCRFNNGTTLRFTKYIGGTISAIVHGNYLGTGIYNNDKTAIELNAWGNILQNDISDPKVYIRGTIDLQGGIAVDDSRVVTQDYIAFEKDTIIAIKEGFAVIKAIYADNKGLIARRVFNHDKFVYVPSNTFIRLCIYKPGETEDANIEEFVNAISVYDAKYYMERINERKYATEYVNGVILAGSGQISTDYNYAWTPTQNMVFPHDVVLCIYAGWYIIYATYDSEGNLLTRNAVYTTYLKIPAGTYFNFSIRVTNDPIATYDKDYYISKVWFETNMLRKNPKFSIRRPLLSIVDDDGAKAFYTYLLPIVREKHVPIASAVMASTQPLENDTRLLSGTKSETMNLSEIKECIEAGVEIIGHGYTDLRTLSLEEAENELRETKRNLHDNGIDITGYAYPFGGDSKEIRNLANKYYDYALWRTDQSGQIFSNYGNIADYQIIRFQFGGYYNIEAGRFIEENIHPYTIEAFKMVMDEAIEKNGWVVICLHSWLMVGNDRLPEYSNIDQLALLKDAIDYALSQNVDIVTCEEGYRMFGNAVIAGDYLGNFNTEGYSISKEGNVDSPNET